MEFVPGLPITKYCEEHGLGPTERLELFIQVCEGVQHAHQKAIIHRDLKPANILVSEVNGKPAARVIDFGLAKTVSPVEGGEDMLTRVGGFVGTPGYMAPEQTGMGAHDVDTRADFYWLGVILYELLAGTEPFDRSEWRNKTIVEVFRQLHESAPPLPSTRIGSMPAGPGGAAPGVSRKLLRGDLDSITMKALERERDRATRITEFMANMFQVSDPSESRGNSVTGREILDPASAQIGKGLSRDPELQAEMMYIMADVYQRLGLDSRAQPLLARSAELDRAAAGPDAPVTLRSESELAMVLGEAGHNRDAEKLQRSVLQAQLRTLGPGSEETLRSENRLAIALDAEGKYPEAEKLYREVFAVRRRALGADDRLTLAAEGNLADLLDREGHGGEAMRLSLDTLERRRRVLGADHPDTVSAMTAVAAELSEAGRYKESEQVAREAIAIQSRVLGPEHPAIILSEGNLTLALFREGRYPEVEKLLRSTLDASRRVFGPEHPVTLRLMTQLATTLRYEKRLGEAANPCRELLERQRQVLGPEHVDTLATLSDLGALLTDEHRYTEAEKYLSEVLETDRRVLGRDHLHTAIAAYNLACDDAMSGHRRQALALLRESVEHGGGPLVAGAIGTDENLKSLHGDPQFQALVAEAKQKAEAEAALRNRKKP